MKDVPKIPVEGDGPIFEGVEDPEDVRKYFKQVYDIYKKFDLDILSMGMSNDYNVAVEEGANTVRVGSAIFGKRIYTKEQIGD